LKEDDMCLSNIYLNKKEEERLFIEEASQVIADKQGVQVDTLFGDIKHLEDYVIKEVNLMENYIILGRR